MFPGCTASGWRAETSIQKPDLGLECLAVSAAVSTAKAAQVESSLSVSSFQKYFLLYFFIVSLQVTELCKHLESTTWLRHGAKSR